MRIETFSRVRPKWRGSSPTERNKIYNCVKWHPNISTAKISNLMMYYNRIDYYMTLHYTTV